jgi:hypothetical protein
MKSVWKWILGIVILLVVVAAVVGGVYLVRTSMSMRAALNNGQRPNQPNGQSAPNNGQRPNVPNGQAAPGQPYGPRGGNNPEGSQPGWNGQNMHRGNDGFRGGPMMGGRGFMPGMFMPFGMGIFFLGGLVRLIIPLGVLVLVAFIAYRLGKNAGKMAVAESQTSNAAEVPDASAKKTTKSRKS